MGIAHDVIRRVTILTDSIKWLLRFEFSVAVAAPLPATLQGEVGTLTVVDTTNLASIDGGDLVLTGPAATNFTDPRLYDAAIIRVAGVALICAVKTDMAVMPGWRSTVTGGAASVLYAAYWGGTANHVFWNAVTNTTLQSMTDNVFYEVALVLQTTGVDIFLRGGSEFPVWTKLFRYRFNSTSPLYPSLQIGGIAGVSRHAYARVRQLPGAFRVDEGLAVINAVNPPTGTVYSAIADALHDMAFTLPGSPNAGDTIELRYRVQDNTPTSEDLWKAYIKRNAGNTAWDFLLDSMAAGVATNRITLTGVGTPIEMQVRAIGTKHNCWTLAGTTWTKRGGEINVSLQDTQSDIIPVYAVGSVSSLISDPATSSQYDILSKTS